MYRHFRPGPLNFLPKFETDFLAGEQISVLSVKASALGLGLVIR